MTNKMNQNLIILLKIALTIPVSYGLAYPFLHPTTSGGIFKEIELLGVLGSVVLTTIFLALIFLYCRDLQRSLSLVRISARKANPRSVWLMFLLPYNFIEDFFIMANVAKSLQQEAQQNLALQPFKSFGMMSGVGWCTAQIISLLPNEIGSLAGIIALPLWIVHWRLIHQINSALSQAALTNT